MSCRSGRRLQPGDERQDFSGECGLKRPTKGGITTESFGTEVTTGPEREEMPIHAHLSQSNYYLIVLLGHKLMRLPFMSTIELVDPELRDALALGPQLPLTAESLMRRRANALELIDPMGVRIATGALPE